MNDTVLSNYIMVLFRDTILYKSYFKGQILFSDEDSNKVTLIVSNKLG